MYTSARTTIGTAIISLALTISPQALALNDIQVSLVGGKLVIDEQNTAAIATETGYKLFVAEFEFDTQAGYRATDPGFLASAGTFLSGEQLWFHPIAITFDFHRAATAYDLNGRQLHPGDEDRNYGPIGVSDSEGGIHSHIRFGPPSPKRGSSISGADILTLELTSRDASGLSPTSYVDSDPFHIVFNRGLSSEAFAQTVNALISPVPEPETYAMLLAGLGLMGFMTRRRQTS